LHILQYIAVKADSAEEAIDNVRTELENQMGEIGSGVTWYDWFVTGGGRFNPDSDPYTDGQTNMIISSQDSEAFEQTLVECIGNRVTEFNRYRDEWNRSNVNLEATLDTYEGTTDYSMSLYPIGKMVDMLQGEWDFNSYFYDLDNWSTNPIHMNSDRINNGSLWFLVPVDFHF
jgi:hypothetical protein